ncbi:MAG: hypothetical protein ACK5JT_24125 [Hyphomicrobiaceae bacterium]
MQPTDGGFLRLDTATGDMSLCKRTAASFECAPVKDDRDLQAEVGRLAAENKDLKAEISRLQEQLGREDNKDLVPDARPGPGLQLPSEEDVDKALSYMQRMIKKFREKMKEFDEQTDPHDHNDGKSGSLPGTGKGKGTPL